MRICRDGHGLCAEALRETKGIASAVPPAAMKWRRSSFTDMIPSRFLPKVLHQVASAIGNRRDRLAHLKGRYRAYSGVIRTVAPFA
jgi:hypothetical protein